LQVSVRPFGHAQLQISLLAPNIQVFASSPQSSSHDYEQKMSDHHDLTLEELLAGSTVDPRGLHELPQAVVLQGGC